MRLLLQQPLAMVANQYLNTSRASWKGLNATEFRLFLIPMLAMFLHPTNKDLFVGAPVLHPTKK
jgi:hypothetical protein